MLGPILLLLVGFVLLAVGAEVLVSGSSRLAIRMGITPLVIGLTIVAFGTSAPELAVSIEAATTGRSTLALGNVIGSNIANIGLILGITALICPIKIEAQLVRRQIPLMIAVSFLLCVLLLDRHLGFIDGTALSLGLLGFLIYSYRSSGSQLADVESTIAATPVPTNKRYILINVLLIVGGLALLIVGSHVFVESAIDIARQIGISEAVVGLTIVAVGTSVPELATSMVAALRKESDIAIGNIVGSNLFNILGILGATSLISTISAAEFSATDLVIMLVFACALLPLAWTGLMLSRLEGGVLLAGYTGYIAYLII